MSTSERNCPDCDGGVPAAASACPYCGRAITPSAAEPVPGEQPTGFARIAYILLGLAVLLLMFVSWWGR